MSENVNSTSTPSTLPRGSESSQSTERNNESPFLREFKRISDGVRPTFFMPEAVRPLGVYEIESTPVADSLFDKKQDGTPDMRNLFVGTDSHLTHEAVMTGEKVDSKYVSTSTDGRVIRIDFKGGWPMCLV